MSSRAAVMATAGDPFVTLTAYKLFKDRWYDEVDEFWININNHCDVPKDVIGEMLAVLALDPKVHIIYHSRGIGNGPPITEMIKLCTKDHILILEEDFFIFDSGYVNSCFQQIESDLVDAIGSPRFSCGVEVGEASQRKYKLNYGGYGDVGCNFWPSGFFCKRADLLKTDLDFGSHTWQPGEYSKELDHTFKEINHADTFGWMCVQLRALGLRFGTVPQHHASPYEIEDKEKGEQNWHRMTQPFHWLHGGSLSTSWGGYLSGRVPDVSAEISKREIETRAALWTICMHYVDGFEGFWDPYMKGIADLVSNAGLSEERIHQKINLYKELLRL